MRNRNPATSTRYAFHSRHWACTVTLTAVAACGLLLTGCGGDAGSAEAPVDAPSIPAASEELDRVVSIDDNRGLYVRCTGSGSPTVVMEGGDGDTSDSYAFAEPSISKVTRTCVYDRANLGQSDPAPGPRGLSDLVGDLEALLRAAEIPGPYVLVGTSGGGYISAGYAYEHPDQVAGMVFVEVPAPFRDPPQVIVEETDPNSPSNTERRDYLQVEKDAWAARKRIGDIPFTIISNEYSTAEISASPFPSEARGMRRNVSDQQGWLVLSPQATQVVVHTGHAVEEEDPDLVIDAILDVVKEASMTVERKPELTADLVGSWVTRNVCGELVRALEEADLEEFIGEMVSGQYRREDPAEIASDPDPCRGAASFDHSHEFSADGRFASYDESGQQVDEGTYTILEHRTLLLSRPPLEIEVR